VVFETVTPAANGNGLGYKIPSPSPVGQEYGIVLGGMAEVSISNHGSVAFRDWFNWATLPYW